MVALMMASWRHYRHRYLATSLAVLLGVGFCAALLTVSSAARRGASDAAVVQYGAAGQVLTAQQRADALSALTNRVDVLGTFLTGFSVVALVVAGLVIANTFRIVMAQRGKDLALLRCVGAQRWQVFASTAGEGVLVGLLASLAGTATGIALGEVAVQVMRRTSAPVPLSAAPPDLRALLVPFGAGVLTAVAAVVPAAWRVAAQPPLAAVLREELGAPERSKAGLRAPVTALLLGAGGVGLLGMGAATGRLAAGLAGGALSFMAVLVASPLLVSAGISLAGRARRLVPRRLRGGVPADLALHQAVRNRRRTAATVAALMVGVTLISTMSVGAASVSATESRAVDRVAPIDVVVSGGTVTRALAERVRQVPGVEDTVVAMGATLRTARGSVEVVALGGTASAAVVRDPGLRSLLADPTGVVVPVSAQGEVPGDGTGRFALVGNRATVRVSPLYSSLQSGPMLASPAVLARLGVAEHPMALYLRLSDAADPVSLVSDLQNLVGQSRHPDGLTVDGGYAKRSTYDHVVSVMLLTATAMLAVAVLIALVGVGNTLSLSVLERTREHGLLRALGLTRRQMRLMLAGESLLIAASAAVLGTALGIAYGWIGTVTLLHGALNHSPTLVVPLGRLALVCAVALAAGVLASVFPARRAARLSPVEGLAAE